MRDGERRLPATEKGGGSPGAVVPVPPPHLAAGAYLQDHLSESAATLLGALCLRTQGAGRDETVSPQPPGLPLRAARGPRRRRAESACSAPPLPTTRARGAEASSTPRGAFSVQPKGDGTGKSGESQSYPGAVGFLRVEGQVTAGILEVEGQVTAMGLVPSIRWAGLRPGVLLAQPARSLQCVPGHMR